MTEFAPFFSNYKTLEYREFVILRYHNISKRKICKMYNIAYFRIVEICEKVRKNDFRFTYKDYQYLKSFNVSNAFICKMYRIDSLDLEFFEVMNS